MGCLWEWPWVFLWLGWHLWGQLWGGHWQRWVAESLGFLWECLWVCQLGFL